MNRPLELVLVVAVATLAWAGAARVFARTLRAGNRRTFEVGSGRVFDPFLADHGSWIYAACVAAAVIDAATAGSGAGLGPFMRRLGLVAFIAFAGLFVWVDAVLSDHFRQEPSGAGPLLVRGPYRFIRHPRYLCWLGLLAGFSIALESLLGLLLTGGFFLLVRRRIDREERFLLQTYGARYADYAAHTYRLVPFVW